MVVVVMVVVVVVMVVVVMVVFILLNDLAAGSGQFCNVVNKNKIAKTVTKKRSEPVLWLRGPLWTGGACVWRLRPRPSRHKQRDTHGPACPNDFFFVIFYVLLFLFSFLKEKKKEILKIKNRSKERTAVDKRRSRNKRTCRWWPGVDESFHRLLERRVAVARGEGGASGGRGCEMLLGWCRDTKSMRRISIWSDGNERKRSLCVPTSWRR